jgi:DNA-binding PadR family transcriptional regulator
MALSPKGDLTASMAILGLVVQEADTLNGVRSRLAERFPNAAWSRSIAYSAMPSLARRGSIRIVRSGAVRSLDLYEATPAGVASFRRWLRQVPAPPGLRDALRAKLAFVASEDDLLAVLEAIREQEEASIEAAEEARKRLAKARRQWQRGRAKDGDWRSRVQRALLADEARQWDAMSERLRRLGLDLEGVTSNRSQVFAGMPGWNAGVALGATGSQVRHTQCRARRGC